MPSVSYCSLLTVVSNLHVCMSEKYHVGYACPHFSVKMNDGSRTYKRFLFIPRFKNFFKIPQ